MALKPGPCCPLSAARLQAFSHALSEAYTRIPRWQDKVKNVVISERSCLPNITDIIESRRTALFGHVVRLPECAGPPSSKDSCRRAHWPTSIFLLETPVMKDPGHLAQTVSEIRCPSLGTMCPQEGSYTASLTSPARHTTLMMLMNSKKLLPVAACSRPTANLLDRTAAIQLALWAAVRYCSRRVIEDVALLMAMPFIRLITNFNQSLFY